MVIVPVIYPHPLLDLTVAQRDLICISPQTNFESPPNPTSSIVPQNQLEQQNVPGNRCLAASGRLNNMSDIIIDRSKELLIFYIARY